jgi:serine/threonine-protein kinase
MGVVYRARERALDRTVALKLVAPQLAAATESRERFMVESRLAASLEHPAVVPIYAAGESDGQLYIAMRCIEGSDLKRELQTGPLPPALAITICHQVAAALDAAHELGLVHRDVKPSNVLLDTDSRAYLADFGLTRLTSAADARPPLGSSLGTIEYVAPEQIRGEPVDGRADAYSLACVLHECLTGYPPFRHGSEVAVLFAHLEQAPPAPPGLEEVMARALAKDPALRYGTCTEMVDDAAAALGLHTRRRSRWRVAAATLAIVLSASVALALFVASGAPPAAASGGQLAEIAPSSNTVTHTIPIGGEPSAVAAGAGRVWATSTTDGAVRIITPRSLAVRRVSVPFPTAVAVWGGIGYVMAGDGVDFIEPTGAELSTLSASGTSPGNALQEIATGTGGVWGITWDTVYAISRHGTYTWKAAERVPIPAIENEQNARSELDGFAVGEGALWVVGDASDRRMWELRDGRIVATVPLAFAPGGMAVGSGGVWVSDQLGDRLVEIDPSSLQVLHSIHVGHDPVAVAVGAGGVWVANAADGTVSKVDPQADRVTDTIHVGGTPTAIAVGEGHVWVVGSAT